MGGRGSAASRTTTGSAGPGAAAVADSKVDADQAEADLAKNRALRREATDLEESEPAGYATRAREIAREAATNVKTARAAAERAEQRASSSGPRTADQQARLQAEATRARNAAENAFYEKETARRVADTAGRRARGLRR